MEDSNCVCLICTSPASPHEFGGRWSSLSQFSEMLHNYFVLKHVLCLPEDMLRHHVQFSLDLTTPIFCERCSVAYLDKCVTVFRELAEVQRRFRRARQNVVEAVKESLRQNGGNEWSQWSEIRNYVGQCDGTEMDYGLGDILAAEKLKALNKAQESHNLPPEIDIKPEPRSPQTSNLEDDAEYFSDSRSTSPQAKSHPKAVVKRCGKMFSCTECSFKDSKYLSVWNHKKRFHSADLSSFSCSVCGVVYMRSATLRRHMAFAHPPETKKMTTNPVFRSIHAGETDGLQDRPEFPKTGKGPCDPDMKIEPEVAADVDAAHDSQNRRKTRHKMLIRRVGRKMFSCPECDFKGPSYLSVWNHKKRAHATDLSSFTCPICKFVYTRSATLRRHMAFAHAPEKKKITCELCQKKYVGSVSFRDHLAVAHSIRKYCRYKCTVQGCRLSFYTTSRLEKHKLNCSGRTPSVNSKNSQESEKRVKTKRKLSPSDSRPRPIVQRTGSGLFSCTECDFQSAKYLAVWSHKKRVHSRDLSSVTCSVCNIVYSRSDTLRKHLAVAHSGEREKLSCTHCEKRYTEVASFREHLAVAHSIEKFCRFKCDEPGCSLCFYTDRRLKKHKFRVHRPGCPECGKVVKSEAAMEIHKKSHLPPEERFYECSKCDKVLKSHGGLQNHIRDDHGQRKQQSVKCGECGNVFANKMSLNCHFARIHKKQYQKTCESCGAVFFTNLQLLDHQVEAHNVCKVSGCREAYGGKEELYNHQMSEHKDGIQYLWKCDQCGKFLSKRSRFRRHMTIHDIQEKKRLGIGTEGEFVCELCGKAFMLKDYLQYHVWHTHKQGRKNKTKMEQETISSS